MRKVCLIAADEIAAFEAKRARGVQHPSRRAKSRRRRAGATDRVLLQPA
jgi:hypothetical protein